MALAAGGEDVVNECHHLHALDWCHLSNQVHDLLAKRSVWAFVRAVLAWGGGGVGWVNREHGIYPLHGEHGARQAKLDVCEPSLFARCGWLVLSS